MSGWIFALLSVGALAVAWWCMNLRTRRNLEKLEAALDDLASGKAPGNLVFLGQRFSRMAGRLEQIAEQLRDGHREIRRAESNIETILGGMEEGVIVVDDQHVLRRINPSFLKAFDLKQDPRGQTVLRVLRDMAIEEMVAAALKTGERQTAELSLNGSKPARHFVLTTVPIRDDEGREGVVAIFRDISRLRQLEDVRREFVANVSHELRTPLAIFHGYVENLLDDPAMSAENQREVFDILRKHSLRLNALLEDLLTLARLESRHDALQLQPVALPTFLEELTVEWRRRLAKKKVQLEIDLPTDLSPWPADPLRLEQVFTNLLENAAKYTEAGGTIAIRGVVEREILEIRVEDTGIGIPPNDLPHIFERFYRADKARTRNQGGTGLGLAIVKHIVQSHGGVVRAESTYGKGTAIIFRLPRVEEPAAVELEPTPAA